MKSPNNSASLTSSSSPKHLEFTGERYHPEILGEIRLEHLHRYSWILDLLHNRSVLDVACGEGYGSSLLATVASNVVGVDIETDAITHAQNRYASDFLSFQRADATALPFDDDTFDAVVSFETIEHIEDHDLMVSEIHRVLKPDGFAIISSPDLEVYSLKQGHCNPYHLKELTHSEFEALLKTKFPHVRLFGQRLAIGSLILPTSKTALEPRLLRDSTGDIEQLDQELPHSMYAIAICAQEPGNIPPVTVSAIFAEHYDLYWDLRDQLEASNLYIRQLSTFKEAGRICQDPIFDFKFYLKQIDAPRFQDPFSAAFHYVSTGENEGLRPSRTFDPTIYFAENPDVSASGMNALYHYIAFGKAEGRAFPLISSNKVKGNAKGHLSTAGRLKRFLFSIFRSR